MATKIARVSNSQMGDDLPSKIKLSQVRAIPDDERTTYTAWIQCNCCGQEEEYSSLDYVPREDSSEEADRCHDCAANDWTVLRCTYEGQEVVED